MYARAFFLQSSLAARLAGRLLAVDGKAIDVSEDCIEKRMEKTY